MEAIEAELLRRRNGDAPTLELRLTGPDAPKRAGGSNSTVTRPPRRSHRPRGRQGGGTIRWLVLDQYRNGRSRCLRTRYQSLGALGVG